MNLENSFGDPCIINYKNEYYVFGSEGTAYYSTTDFINWNKAANKPAGFAPGLWIKEDTLFYYPFEGNLYRTTTPKTGGWVNLGKPFNFKDPAFFIDDDNKVYAIYGCAENNPLTLVELDPAKSYAAKSGRLWQAVVPKPTKHGWERQGNNNELTTTPWIEGGWIFKYNNKYYAHYSAPGTEFKTYADGIFMATSIEGPWVYALNSPFSHKPTGFITSAGHGATFKHSSGALFRVVTMLVNDEPSWDRRMGLIAVAIDADGLMYAHNYFSDYPQFLPGKNPGESDSNFTGWMNVAYAKTVTASSGADAGNAVDDNIRTAWKAASGAAGEWLKVDMGKTCTVQGVQVNFTSFASYKYVVELSTDSVTWATVVDKSTNSRTIAHEYTQLAAPTEARYARITNKAAGSSFSQSDFRVFGNASGTLAATVSSLNATRMPDDMGAVLSWSASSGAQGYVVRYGIAPTKFYNCYEIRGGATSIEIRSLNADVDYYCTVDAFNDVGVAKSGAAVMVKSLTSKTQSYRSCAISTHNNIGDRNGTGVINMLGRSMGEINILPSDLLRMPVSPGLYIYQFNQDKSAVLPLLFLRSR